MKVITIGRSSQNNVVINDPKVSRHHCQIVQYDDGSYGIVDFGSTNGTYVNGRRVYGEERMNPNDEVRVGYTTLPWRNYFGTVVPPPKKTNVLPIVLGIAGGVLVMAAMVVLLVVRFGGVREKEIFFTGDYPPVAQVTFEQDGYSRSIEAVQGQVMVYFADEVSNREALRAIKKAGGEVVAQIPKAHYYLVSTRIGGESAFIQEICSHAIVDYICPNALSYTCVVMAYVMDDFTDDSDGATHGELVSYTLQECGSVKTIKHFEENVDGEGLKWSEIVQDLNSILSNASEDVFPVINMSFGVPLKVAGKKTFWNNAPDSSQSNYRDAYIYEMEYLLKQIEKYDSKDFVIVKSSGNDGVKDFDKEIIKPLYNKLNKKQRAIMDKHVILVAAEDTRWTAYSNELEKGVNHQWVTKIDISDLKYKGEDIHGTSFSAPRTSCYISTASEKFNLKPTEVLKYVRKATKQAPDHVLTQELLEKAIEEEKNRENTGNGYKKNGCLKYRLVKDKSADMEHIELINTCDEDIRVAGYFLNKIAPHGGKNTLDFETIVRANGTEYVEGFIENECTITSVEKVEKKQSNTTSSNKIISSNGVPPDLVGTKWGKGTRTLEFVDRYHVNVVDEDWENPGFWYKRAHLYDCYYDSKHRFIVILFNSLNNKGKIEVHYLYENGRLYMGYLYDDGFKKSSEYHKIKS